MSKDGTVRRTLFVSGFSHSIRNKELWREFERFGPVVRCDIPTPGGRSRGYAFIEFVHEHDAQEAYDRLHGRRISALGERELIIQWTKRAPAPGWKPGEEREGRRESEREAERERDGRDFSRERDFGRDGRDREGGRDRERREGSREDVRDNGHYERPIPPLGPLPGVLGAPYPLPRGPPPPPLAAPFGRGMGGLLAHPAAAYYAAAAYGMPHMNPAYAAAAMEMFRGRGPYASYYSSAYGAPPSRKRRRSSSRSPPPRRGLSPSSPRSPRHRSPSPSRRRTESSPPRHHRSRSPSPHSHAGYDYRHAPPHSGEAYERRDDYYYDERRKDPLAYEHGRDPYYDDRHRASVYPPDDRAPPRDYYDSRRPYDDRPYYSDDRDRLSREREDRHRHEQRPPEYDRERERERERESRAVDDIGDDRRYDRERERERDYRSRDEDAKKSRGEADDLPPQTAFISEDIDIGGRLEREPSPL